ncbi:hypothetical protein COCNU_06G020200 [Cocos nucifera]|uniref:Uncharacterized protein n=1 Tax=Cocos nucifera TaxID=13894 RepID=A0A8K0IDE4_COCNU|nr:hypothetical protein COCNU_06G020200 [Cocos nucifera]
MAPTPTGVLVHGGAWACGRNWDCQPRRQCAQWHGGLRGPQPGDFGGVHSGGAGARTELVLLDARHGGGGGACLREVRRACGGRRRTNFGAFP